MVRKSIVLLLVVLFSTAGFQLCSAQDAKHWFQGGHWQHMKTNPKAKILPLIKVQGNKFVDPQGKTMLFRGIAISDPDKVEVQGHWNKEHFGKVKEMGANIIRIPVHPIAWRERTPEKYIKLLDEAVDWCTDLGMYVMIDWHSIGNIETEIFQDPMYNTTKRETYEFWRTISKHFSGNNTIAFYELLNEPTTYHGQLGSLSWADWKKTVENIISIIRAHDKETIPLVAGFDWAYDLTPLREEPINAEGIGYVTHPYPNKRSQPWTLKWEENFGFAADTYPVFATEFGFDIRTGTIDPDGDHYGNQIIGYLESKGISWTIWVFDPEWGGAKIKSWNYELTPGGEFFKQAMQGKLQVQKNKFAGAQINPVGETRHTFLCADYTQGIVCIISNEGKIVWQYPAVRCNDVWALPNGNILFNTGNGVKEVTRDKNVVFSYVSKSEIYACQRLSNGNTFIGECNSGRLLEVSPAGKIIKEIKLLPDNVDGGHSFMRNARKLENGNYLVAHYGLDKVCEYDSLGKLIMEIPVTGGPHSVIRLSQGNTLIACSDHNGDPRVVEMDKSGMIVWQLSKNEISGIELKFMTGMQCLPSGNLLLTNWVGHDQFGKAPHAFEITRDKQVIWVFNDHTLLKTMSSIQLLDLNTDYTHNNVLH